MNVDQDPTLDEAIEQQINLGEKDPAKIAHKLIALYGPEWLQKRLLAAGEEIVTSLARLRLGGRRRVAEGALIAQPTRWQKAGADLLLEAKWVSPEVGWKRIADLTAEDCETIARHYGSLALAASRRREWFQECAQKIKAAGVEKLGELKDLPMLGEGEAA